MKKLSLLPETFSDYLTTAGYQFHPVNRFCGYFTRGRIRVSISHNKIEVAHLERAFASDAEPVGVRKFFSVTGFDQLDLIGWAELLDMTGALPLKEVLSQISRKEVTSLLSELARRINWPGPGPRLQEHETPTPTLASYQEQNY